jgi:hypothetical protein
MEIECFPLLLIVPFVKLLTVRAGLLLLVKIKIKLFNVRLTLLKFSRDLNDGLLLLFKFLLVEMKMLCELSPVACLVKTKTI